MQIQSHFAPPTPRSPSKRPRSRRPPESFEPSKPEDNGLMPKPPQQNEKLSGVASGALYGGLAGAGFWTKPGSGREATTIVPKDEREGDSRALSDRTHPRLTHREQCRHVLAHGTPSPQQLSWVANSAT